MREDETEAPQAEVAPFTALEPPPPEEQPEEQPHQETAAGVGAHEEVPAATPSMDDASTVLTDAHGVEEQEAVFVTASTGPAAPPEAARMESEEGITPAEVAETPGPSPVEAPVAGGPVVEAAGIETAVVDDGEVETPAAAMTPPPAAYSPTAYERTDPAKAAAEGRPAAWPPEEEEPEYEGGPNWMLAFVCAWAGATSLYQAWDITRRVDLIQIQRMLALAGFSSLGIGLLAFGVEALLWNRVRRTTGSQILLVLIPLLLTLAGVVCLFMFKDPDPTRSRI
jgi:hypothetical protein